MDDVNYDILKNNLKEKIIKLFYEYTKSNDIKNICGFCLNFDDKKLSFSVGFNTVKNYKEKIKTEIFTKELIELDAMFNVDIWFEFIKIGSVRRLLNIRNKIKYKAKDLKDIKLNICEISLDLLDELKNLGLFNNTRNDFVILFLTEYDTPKMVYEGNKNFNLEKIVVKYDKWLDKFDIKIQFEDWPNGEYEYHEGIIKNVVRRHST